jgi:hypothetical protein
MKTATLQELHELAAKLLATARKLPPGQDRHNALREVGKFRLKITNLQRHYVREAEAGKNDRTWYSANRI